MSRAEKFPAVDAPPVPGARPEGVGEDWQAWWKARDKHNGSVIANRKHVIAVALDEMDHRELSTLTPSERVSYIVGLCVLDGVIQAPAIGGLAGMFGGTF